MAYCSFDGYLFVSRLKFTLIRELKTLEHNKEHSQVEASWCIMHLDPEWLGIPATYQEMMRSPDGDGYPKRVTSVAHLAYNVHDDCIYTVAHKMRLENVYPASLEIALEEDKEDKQKPFDAGSKSRQIVPHTVEKLRLQVGPSQDYNSKIWTVETIRDCSK